MDLFVERDNREVRGRKSKGRNVGKRTNYVVNNLLFETLPTEQLISWVSRIV